VSEPKDHAAAGVSAAGASPGAPEAPPGAEVVPFWGGGGLGSAMW